MPSASSASPDRRDPRGICQRFLVNSLVEGESAPINVIANWQRAVSR
jgi:hypothetical protein